MQDNNFYVYAHYIPGSETPFYVGKGHGKRAYKKNGRSKHWHNTVKKHGLVVEILAKGLDENTALRMEEDFIYLYGRRDLKTGPLVNMTDGGEGCSGAVRSKETRAKMGAANKGKTFSEEHKAKIGAASKGRIHTAETRAKMSAAGKGNKYNLGKPQSAAHTAASRAGRQARTIANGRLPGTSFHKRDQKWVAGIYISGKCIYLGLFPTEQLAHDAFNEAKAKLGEVQ